MTIIHRQEPRRSRRVIKVPKFPIPEREMWDDQESDEDPSFTPGDISTSESDVSLLTESCTESDSETESSHMYQESIISSDSDTSG